MWPVPRDPWDPAAEAAELGCGKDGFPMEVLYPHCAGLDVHKRSVVACVGHTDGRGHATFTLRTFGSTTPELLELQAWLQHERVTHVAMEATGSYWKPVYNPIGSQLYHLGGESGTYKECAGP